uniref:Carn_acyltransf domain-containing protein n=2 Tax=Caenorhabditis japonica TaxID=281687 RepID=A0A8R1HJE2_CAEJA
MSTFSRQDQLPSLPVPSLVETLEKYRDSASALLTADEKKRLDKEIHQFQHSELGTQLQEALEKRAATQKNWVEEWWYNLYTDIREPLAPYVSFGAVNTTYNCVEGGQLSRAADVLHHWASVWDKLRHGKWPVASSRGVTWDMDQFHNVLTSNRTPGRPRDTIDRYFKTKEDGDTPHHVIISCNGCLWKVNILNVDDDTVKSADELYNVLKVIKDNSSDETKTSVTKLTTTNRDVWRNNREDLRRISGANRTYLRDIETAILHMCLTNKNGGNDPQHLISAALQDESWFVWQDKSVCVTVYEDAQVTMQADHSNVDAIVLLQLATHVAARARKHLWQPIKTNANSHFEFPERLVFEIDESLRNSIVEADVNFYRNKKLYRAGVVDFHGYGNDLCRASKVFADTVVQFALQLAFLRAHGSFAPIYETASTRKFYHGRTETVRGCTPQFVKFANALLDNKSSKEEVKRLFDSALDAHNQFMAICMEGRGFDRHLLGLKETLSIMNKGCGPKRALPSFMTDETWKKTGGDGNFLLSTSFLGYMDGNEPGTYGFVTAMRKDGYGCFYKIGKERVTVAVSDWISTRSNLQAFSDSIIWALDALQPYITPAHKL